MVDVELEIEPKAMSVALYPTVILSQNFILDWKGGTSDTASRIHYLFLVVLVDGRAHNSLVRLVHPVSARH